LISSNKGNTGKTLVISIYKVEISKAKFKIIAKTLLFPISEKRGERFFFTP